MPCWLSAGKSGDTGFVQKRSQGRCNGRLCVHAPLPGMPTRSSGCRLLCCCLPPQTPAGGDQTFCPQTFEAAESVICDVFSSPSGPSMMLSSTKFAVGGLEDPRCSRAGQTQHDCPSDGQAGADPRMQMETDHSLLRDGSGQAGIADLIFAAQLIATCGRKTRRVCGTPWVLS